MPALGGVCAFACDSVGPFPRPLATARDPQCRLNVDTGCLLRVESRRGAVALGRACLFPPLSSGGALVAQPWLRFHAPLIEPDVQISRIRLSDKTSRRLSRATPSAASEHHLELIGCPVSMSFATSRVCLELRPLPSAGVTRFPRYYEPLRHPTAPGLSLTGVRLVLSSLT